MRTVLILNPTSGISTVTEKPMSVEDTEKAILQGLQAWGIEPEVSYTTPEDTGKGLATRAAAEHSELVIAVGGDGTISCRCEWVSRYTKYAWHYSYRHNEQPGA